MRYKNNVKGAIAFLASQVDDMSITHYRNASGTEMGKITCKMILIKDQDQQGQRSKIKIKDHFSRNDLRSKIRSFQKITYYIKMDVVQGSCRYCNCGTLSRYLPNYQLIQSHFALGQIAMLYPVSSLVMGLREIEGIRAIGQSSFHASLGVYR